MKPRPRALTVALVAGPLALGMAIGVVMLVHVAAKPAAVACGSWTVSIPGGHGGLNAIDAVAPDDVWAVGSAYDPVTRNGLDPPILHFDGTSWRSVPHPSVEGELVGLAALSKNDVWVAGKKILHYDGTNWRVFELPVFGNDRVEAPLLQASEVVNDLAALSPKDVWAAGVLVTDQGTNGLLMHWDGNRWAMEPSSTLTPDRNSSLQAISARSANDVWAVGTGGTPPSLGGVPLIMHWDGTSWTEMAAPMQPARTEPTGQLYDVTVAGASDAWAVGTALDGRAFIQRLDGGTWPVVFGVPDPPDFHGISAVSSADAWSVGGDSVWHWDGRAWLEVHSTVPHGDLLGVATTGGHVWVVGSVTQRGPASSIESTSLIEHYCA